MTDDDVKRLREITLNDLLSALDVARLAEVQGHPVRLGEVWVALERYKRAQAFKADDTGEMNDYEKGLRDEAALATLQSTLLEQAFHAGRACGGGVKDIAAGLEKVRRMAR